MPLYLQNTKETAQRLGLVGWVQNTPTKTVIGNIQGPADKIEHMWVGCDSFSPYSKFAHSHAWIRHGNWKKLLGFILKSGSRCWSGPGGIQGNAWLWGSGVQHLLEAEEILCITAAVGGLSLNLTPPQKEIFVSSYRAKKIRIGRSVVYSCLFASASCVVRSAALFFSGG